MSLNDVVATGKTLINREDSIFAKMNDYIVVYRDKRFVYPTNEKIVYFSRKDIIQESLKCMK